MLVRVALTFEQYIIRAETFINNYLTVPKMFLETDKFVDTRTVIQINTCFVVNFDLRNVSYYLYVKIHNMHNYLLWHSLLLKREQDNFPLPSTPQYFF